jgi:hypothetical protein
MEPIEEQRVKEDQNKARQLLQRISKDEDLVREQVQQLGDLHAEFRDQFLKSLWKITGNNTFTQLQQLHFPKTWDLNLYEADIQLERSAFKSIQEDVRHLATYKIVSALEEPLIQISYAHVEGLRWVRLCDTMKREAIFEQHRGPLSHPDLQRRRTNLFQALEAMALGLGRAEASLDINLDYLRDDPGYAKRTTSYPKDTLQNLFRQVLDSSDGKWREKDVDVVNSKLLLLYQTEFVLAMNDATPWDGRLIKAYSNIRSLETKLNDDDAHRKTNIPSQPTPGATAPRKKICLGLKRPPKCMLSYSSMPFHERVN